MPPVHVIILAAGLGKRMRSALPKVLHRLAGRPLLARVHDVASTLDPEAVHIVYGHGGEEVRSALGELPATWIEQAERLGTGHAVDQAMPGVPDGALALVLYGDVPLITPATLSRALSVAEKGAFGLVTAHFDDPTGYGRIVREETGRVTGIVEDKDASAEQRVIDEVNTGIIAVDAGRLRRWLAAVDNDNSQGEYYLTDCVALAVADGVEVLTVEPDSVEEVLGVNDRVQLAHLERCHQRRAVEALMLAGATVMDPARLDVRGEVVVGRDVTIDVNVVLEGRVTLEDGAEVGPGCTISNTRVGPRSRILANCVIDEADIGADCHVGPFARLRPGARLDEKVRVGNFVEVKNTVIGAGSKANHLTYLGDTDIGRDVNVGAGTITCNYDGANKHRTVIGDGAFVGSGVELVAPVTVHAGATLGAGSTITSDAPADQLSLARAKQRTVSGWRRPRKGESR